MPTDALTDLVTTRALRVALDLGLGLDAAAAILARACGGHRLVASRALDRLERALEEDDEIVILRAVEALRRVVEVLPPEPAEPSPALHLVAPLPR